MNAILIMGIVLVASLGGNAFLWGALDDSQEEVAIANERRRDALDTAKTCSDSVNSLRIEGDERRKRAQAAIDAARKAAGAANARANGERTRKPAVPGDACASAQIENREWMRKRQGGAQ